MGEEFETLLQQGNVKIERIVSSPHPDNAFQCQTHDEWVALLQGEAVLEIEGEEHKLVSGDHLFIPAGRVHRVLLTSDEPNCIWLAVHIHPSKS
jgi:cupin 2 domain-containing protein